MSDRGVVEGKIARMARAGGAATDVDGDGNAVARGGSGTGMNMTVEDIEAARRERERWRQQIAERTEASLDAAVEADSELAALRAEIAEVLDGLDAARAREEELREAALGGDEQAAAEAYASRLLVEAAEARARGLWEARAWPPMIERVLEGWRARLAGDVADLEAQLGDKRDALLAAKPVEAGGIGAQIDELERRLRDARAVLDRAGRYTTKPRKGARAIRVRFDLESRLRAALGIDPAEAYAQEVKQDG